MARANDAGGKFGRFVLLVSVCIVFAALYLGREVFVPLALAILLSFLLTPPVRWLERLGLGRIVAVLIVVCISLGAIGSVGYVVYRQFVSVVNELPRYEGELQSKLHSISAKGGVFGKAASEFRKVASGGTPAAPGASSGSPPATQPLPVRIEQSRSPLETVGSYASTILKPLATTGLVLVFVIFMLVSREDLRDRMIRLVGHGRINVTTQALDESGTRISRYLGRLAIVNMAYGAIVAGGLWVIGHFLGGGSFPNGLVWGILVGLLRFVPYVGVWIGASMPLILSFALFPGNAVLFATLGMFIVMEVVISQFIEPLWYGASTGMSALAVLVAAVFWTWLWGPIGLLLSTPLTVCLVVIGKHVPQLQFLEILLGDEPVLPPHVRVYQRLIAEDEEEAAELTRDMLEENSLEHIYEQVLIPALAVAQEDRHQGQLDEQRLAFVYQSMRDIVEELADESRAVAERKAANDTEKAAKARPPDEGEKPEALKPRPTLPEDSPMSVLCLPAKSQADEIVCLMLGRLLELRNYTVTVATVDSLASEIVEMVGRQKIDAACISAMPPAAIAHARYLCKRIHARHPDLEMVVGLWMAKGDLDRAKHRIACAETVRLVTTLAAAQEQLDQLALLNRSNAPASAGRAPARSPR